MIVSARQMQQIEEAAFASGVIPADLMEIAGAGLAGAIRDHIPGPAHGLLACGKGHNAGDILVAARHLSDQGWTFEIDCPFPDEELAPLTLHHKQTLEQYPSHSSHSSHRLVVLDGLLGLGAAGPPREPIAGAIERVRDLRQRHHAFVVSADLPSGLNPLTGQPEAPCIEADLTVTFGFCKSALLSDAAANHVGRLHLVPLPGLEPPPQANPTQLITADLVRSLLPPRHFDTHKGNYGRIGLYAGATGFTGAARLCAAGAIKGGGGLVTLFVDEPIYPMVATAASPEVMVKPCRDPRQLLESSFDALAIGPGIGPDHERAVLQIYREATCPLVVDADALNILSRERHALRHAAAPRLLTPHPGEMARLCGEPITDRLATATAFTDSFPVTLLLKGARTLITQNGLPPRFNTTGNPGMASGGMGDVLTGVTAALLGQGLSTYDASAVGAWICGQAGDMALRQGESVQSLTAASLIRSLGEAFNSLARLP